MSNAAPSFNIYPDLDRHVRILSGSESSSSIKTAADIAVAEAIEANAPPIIREAEKAIDLTAAAVRKAIEDKLLDPVYDMTLTGDLSEIENGIDELLPAYKLLDSLDYEPGFILVPTGLSLLDWRKLLEGYEVQRPSSTGPGMVRVPCGGIDWQVDHGEPIPVKPYQTSAYWYPAVISQTQAVPLPNHRADGHFSSAKRILEPEVRGLINPDFPANGDFSVEHLLPTVNMYCALQWAQLFKHQPPVDLETASLLREQLDWGDQGRGAMSASWHCDNSNTLVINEEPLDLSTDTLGIRPAITVHGLKVAGNV